MTRKDLWIGALVCMVVASCATFKTNIGPYRAAQAVERGTKVPAAQWSDGTVYVSTNENTRVVCLDDGPNCAVIDQFTNEAHEDTMEDISYCMRQIERENPSIDLHEALGELPNCIDAIND